MRYQLGVGEGPVPRCRRRPILDPTYQTSGGALLSTSETPEPVTSRSEVGGIDVWEIFFQERHKLILSPNQNLDRIFVLDFLPFFFVKLIKIAIF